MFVRSLRRATAHLPPSTTPPTLPPTFLLPLRAHLTTTTTTTETAHNLPPPTQQQQQQSPPPPPPAIPHPPANQPHPQLSPSTALPLPPPTNPPNHTLLAPLASQPPHYILAHLHARPYLLTAGDTLRLPFRLPNASPGAIIRLNRASLLGSRDYTYRGDPWIDERAFVLRVVVLGVEGELMRVEEKTKRRCRRVKRVKRKMFCSVVRVVELRVTPEGVLGEGEGEEEQTVG